MPTHAIVNTTWLIKLLFYHVLQMRQPENEEEKKEEIKGLNTQRVGSNLQIKRMLKEWLMY